MADGQATYDYTQDQDFLKAPPEQQHAYLSSVDPEYAKAPPEQQQAYRGHLSQHVPTEAEAGAVPPTAPMPQQPSTLRRSNLVSPEHEAETEGIYASPVAPFGAAASIPRAALGLVGGTGARTIASQFTKNPWIQDAATVAGGLFGEGSGAAVDEAAGKIGFTPKSEINTPIGKFKYRGEQPSLGGGAPEPSRGEFEAEQEKSLTDQGKLVKIPSRVTKAKPEVTPMTQSPYYDKFAASRAAAKETAANENVNRPGWTTKLPETMPKTKADFGEGGPGSSQRVTRVPEPNPVPPGENPNNQQSVPRRTTLVQNAKRGKEGAGLQLNQIHGPVLYEPKGTGYSGVREQVPLGGETPIRGGSGKGLTDPTGALERRMASRVSATDSAPPDPIREARLGELRKAVRDPSLSDRDRSIMQSQLNDMESNPGERNTLGDNPSQLKKPQPTMSREEAEAASKKREEGRNARFRK
jgi:hypothetical protein